MKAVMMAPRTMTAAAVATNMARKSPRRSMRIPAGPVAARDTAAMMPTRAPAHAWVGATERGAGAVDADPGRHRGRQGHGAHDADDGRGERLGRAEGERAEDEDRHDRAQADGEEQERYEDRPQDGFEHAVSLIGGRGAQTV